MLRRVPADLLVTGARVRTLDPARPFAEGVAVRAGRIVAVGDVAAVREEAGGAREHLHVAGGAVLPGLVDAHVHPFRGTDGSRGLALHDIADVAGLRSRLADAAASLRDGEWLLGHGLRYEPFADAGIRAGLIEDVLGGAPAALRFFDMHTLLASRRALELAGVDGPRAFAEHAEVVCDPSGRPTGELREWAAIGLVERAIPHPPPAERRAAYAATLRAMNATGLTGAHVMLGDPQLLGVVAELEAEGLLTLRVRMPLWVRPDDDPAAREEWAALRGRGGRRWVCESAKFFADGVIESGTAWLSQPDVNGANVQPFWKDPAAFVAAVAQMAGHGFQCMTHCVGDGAARAALDAYAAAPPSASGAPHRVEHLEAVGDEELARLAREGVAASMQPVCMAGLDRDDPDEAWRAALGERATTLGFRCADVRRAGAVLALGSDWQVAEFDPRLGMAWARARRDVREPAGTPFRTEQALTPLEALEGHTTHAALAAGEQTVAGRIAPGFRGDLTLFAADPVDAGEEDLPDLPVLATVVDGEVVHRAEC